MQYAYHFVKFFGWYEVAGWLHMAMEYCEHGDLKRYLFDCKTLPEDQLLEITSQVLGGLALMHGEGFAHRDLKPAVSGSAECLLSTTADCEIPCTEHSHQKQTARPVVGQAC